MGYMPKREDTGSRGFHNRKVGESATGGKSIMPREKQKKRKKRGEPKRSVATKKQRQNKISKSDNPKGEENKPTRLPFLRS